MAFKRWFGGSESAGSKESQVHSLEDLIVLERYEEAETMLLAELKKRPGALRKRLKLAEVYENSNQRDKAVQEFVALADLYSADGFHDKSKAILSRALRLRPLDEGLKRRLDRYQQAKRMDRSRVIATQGLLAGSGETETGVVLKQHWDKITGSTLVQSLSNEQLKRLFSVMHMIKGEAGRLLALRDSRDARLFLVLQGTVEALYGRSKGQLTSLRTFSAGDILGEGSLLEHRPWPATYRIAEPAILFFLERDGLEKALIGNPDPRAFLSALREQGHDRALAEMVAKMEKD